MAHYTSRQRRILFFRDHAGYCVGSRILGAAALADAEIAAENAGATYEWVADDDADWSWLDQPEFADIRNQPHEVEGCILRDADGNVLASLWSIFDAGNNYGTDIHKAPRLTTILKIFRKSVDLT